MSNQCETLVGKIKTFIYPTMRGIGGISLFILIFALSICFIVFQVWLGIKILPWIAIVTELTFIVDLLIMLPLGVFKRTRNIAAVGLLISSQIYRLMLYLYVLLITFVFCGIIGLLLLPIGAPIAIIIAIINGAWVPIVSIAILTVLYYGSFGLFLKLGNSEKEK